MPKVLSEPDGGSAGRKFRKGEPGLPEQLGEGIIVDGKRIKPEQAYSRSEAMPEAKNFKPLFDKIRAEAEAKEEAMSSRASRMNAMGDSYKKGGAVKSASKRADGIAQRGKTRGIMVMCGGGKV
jgi:hypothetical protein